MKNLNYIILAVSCLFFCCANSSKEEVELIYFKKKCLDNSIAPNQNDIKNNNFIKVDITKNVTYSFIDNNLSCKIYTRYDCIDEDALNGFISIKNDTIFLFMKAKSDGLASSCYCYSFLEYKIKCLPSKKYTVRYIGIKYEPK